MGLITKIYYEWNPEVLIIDINLDDLKSTLLSKKLINQIINDDIIEYRGVNNTRISFINNRVSRVWYGSNSSLIINGTEIIKEFYNTIEPILLKYFLPVNKEFQSIEQIIHYKNSDVLCIICQDSIVNMIGIIKTQ